MRIRTLLLSSLLAWTAAAQADNWPDKPITIVVPSAPGGSTDFVARLIGEGLGKALGQPIVIDNKAGAAGNLGTEAVARAKPDGNTLLMQYSGYHVGNPALFPQIKWNPTKDFVPVALVMRAPHVIAVKGSTTANNLQEFIALGKSNGQGLFYASSGNGSIQHIAGELFEQQAKVPTTHVPYKGAGPAVNDLLGGQVDMFVTTPPSVIGHVASGKLKAFAYAAKQRHPSMPNVPTSPKPASPATKWNPGSRSSPRPEPPRRWWRAWPRRSRPSSRARPIARRSMTRAHSGLHGPDGTGQLRAERTRAVGRRDQVQEHQGRLTGAGIPP